MDWPEAALEWKGPDGPDQQLILYDDQAVYTYSTENGGTRLDVVDAVGRCF